MGNNKRILIVTESYPPILNSAGRLFSELAVTLYQNGFDVVVLTEKPSRYVAENRKPKSMSEEVFGAMPPVIRLPGFPRLRSILILRYFEQLIKMVMYFVVGLAYGYRRNIIIYSPPLPIAVVGVLISKVYRTRSIVNVQDLYPETPILLGVMRNRILISVSRMLERYIYKKASAITVHSEGNREYVIQHGAPREKVVVVFNWVDLGKYSPGPLDNGFRKQYKLRQKFIVSYAGVIGLAQDMDVLVNAAREFKSNSSIQFILAGGGLGYKVVKEGASREGLDNILFLPHLIEKEYIKLLQASDICLVTLVGKLKTPAVPGKLQSIMAIGRPVICSVPAVSDAKTIVEKAGCGIWIDPNDSGGLIGAINVLLQSESRKNMGRSGREYAERHFEHRACIQVYSDLLV